MPMFRVFAERTERIAFVIDAPNQEDAEARYLGEGEEESSETTSLNVVETERVDD